MDGGRDTLKFNMGQTRLGGTGEKHISAEAVVLQGCGGESNKGKDEKERDTVGKGRGHKAESDPRAVWLQLMWELPAALRCSVLKYCDRRVTRTLCLHMLLWEAGVFTLPLSLEHTTNSAMLSWPASPL